MRSVIAPTYLTVFAFYCHDIGYLLDVEHSSDAGQQILAKSTVTHDDVRIATLLDVFDE
jgi:hypothetical protein